MTEKINRGELNSGKSQYLLLKLALLYIFGLSVLIIGPVITLLIGGFKGRTRIEYRILMWVSICFLIVHCYMLFAFFIPYYKQAEIKENTAFLKSYSHTIKMELERYWNDNCMFAENPQILEDEGYLHSSEMVNPFTNRPMHVTAYDPDDHSGSIGYCPVIFEGTTVKFYLIAFGSDETPEIYSKMDGIPEHTIMILGSNIDCCYDKCEDFADILGKAQMNDSIPSDEESIKNVKWMWR